MAHTCPRDGAPLQSGTGGLAEDVCGACQGRFLDTGATHRLFVEILGIRAEILLELAQLGVPREACPGCGSRLHEVQARGVTVDLCRGCGGSWLDGGELARLARDVIAEIRVDGAAPDASGLTLDLSPRAQPIEVRFEVLCVSCDQPLDLSQVNWLINTRPWCPSCAAPYTGWASLLGGRFGPAAILGVLRQNMWGRAASFLRGDSSPLNRSPDVLRIAPPDVERFFAAFFVRARSVKNIL